MPGARRGHTREIDDLVRLYLDDIGRHPLLTKDDEVRLAKVIEEGAAARLRLAGISAGHADRSELEERVRLADRATRDFVNANLRLVVSIARRYQASGLPLLDLIQEGNLGLVHAVEKFDWRRGFKFSTYATWWIRQAIQRGVANSRRTIRLPVHAEDRLRNLQQARDLLEAELGRPATLAELEAESGFTAAEIAEIQQSGWHLQSLSAPLGDGSDRRLEEVLADPSAVDPLTEISRSELRRDVEEFLSLLDAAERDVVRLHLGLAGDDPKIMTEVAAMLGLTLEATRRRHARALAKLRHPSARGGAHRLAS